MATMRDLLEQRTATVQAMRALTDHPAGDGGDLSEDQAKQFDQLKVELTATEKRLERQQLLDDAERRMAAPAIIHGNGRDGQYETRARQFSLVKAILARLGEDVDAGFEREISAEVRHRAKRSFAGIACPDQYFETRVITVGSASPSTGETLYQTQLRPDLFIDRLRSALLVQRLGATVLDGLVGDIDVPKQLSSMTPQHVAEDGALTRTDPVFTEITLRPKTVGAVTSYSRRTLINAQPSIETIVRNDLAAVIAREIDLNALMGDGSFNRPVGVRNTPGVAHLSMAGPTWAQTLAMIASLQSNDADLGNMGWALHPASVAKLRSTVRVAT
jgi:HK97 family phage major capsid protein